MAIRIYENFRALPSDGPLRHGTDFAHRVDNSLAEQALANDPPAL
jgi:hypothetical protein